MLELRTSLVLNDDDDDDDDDYIRQIQAAFLKAQTSFEVICFRIK